MGEGKTFWRSEKEFQETEIGKIPIEWGMSTLGEICNVLTDGSHFSPKEEENGNRIIATVKDMEFNQFSFENCKRISEKDFNFMVNNGCSPQMGDLLISKDGAKCLEIIFVYNQPEEIVVLSSIAIARLKSQFHPQFYRYYLLSPNANTLMMNGYVSGSAIPRVILKDFKQVPVPVPPFPEQKAIAHNLSTLDEKIELNRKMNTTLEEIGKTIFKRWFVDFEFPNEEGKPYKSNGGELEWNEELGKEIPKGWKVGTILEIAELLSGGTPNTQMDKYWGGSISWVSAKDVTASNGTFILSSERTITQEGIENSNAKLLPKFTTIVTARGTVGNYCILGYEMAINQTNYGLKANNEMYDFYLFISLGFLIERMRSHSYGTVFDTITTRTFQELTVVMPSEKMISRFNVIISQFMRQTLHNLEEVQTLVNHRAILLPKLISGKVRVDA